MLAISDDVYLETHAGGHRIQRDGRPVPFLSSNKHHHGIKESKQWWRGVVEVCTYTQVLYLQYIIHIILRYSYCFILLLHYISEENVKLYI